MLSRQGGNTAVTPLISGSPSISLFCPIHGFLSLRLRLARNDGVVIINAVDAEEARRNAGEELIKMSSPGVTIIKGLCDPLRTFAPFAVNFSLVFQKHDQ